MLAEILWYYCRLFTRDILILYFQRIVTCKGQGFGFLITGRAETAAAQYSEPLSAIK